MPVYAITDSPYAPGIFKSRLRTPATIQQVTEPPQPPPTHRHGSKAIRLAESRSAE